MYNSQQSILIGRPHRSQYDSMREQGGLLWEALGTAQEGGSLTFSPPAMVLYDVERWQATI